MCVDMESSLDKPRSKSKRINIPSKIPKLLSSFCPRKSIVGSINTIVLWLREEELIPPNLHLFCNDGHINKANWRVLNGIVYKQHVNKDI
jgi:hypothetical protein